MSTKSILLKRGQNGQFMSKEWIWIAFKMDGGGGGIQEFFCSTKTPKSMVHIYPDLSSFILIHICRPLYVIDCSHFTQIYTFLKINIGFSIFFMSYLSMQNLNFILLQYYKNNIMCLCIHFNIVIYVSEEIFMF